MRCWFLCTIFSAPHKISWGLSSPYLLIKVCFSPKSTLSNTRFLTNYSFCLVFQYLSVRKEQRWILLLLATKQFLASSKWILIYMSRKGAQTQTQHPSSTISSWDGARRNGEMERTEQLRRWNFLLFVRACVLLFQSDSSTRWFLNSFWKDLCKVVWGLFSYFLFKAVTQMPRW